MKKLVIAALAVAGAAACTQKPVEPLPPPPPLTVLSNPSPSMPDGHPALSDLAISSRGPRRMSVDMLERSLDQMADLPAGTVKLPADLAVTLGRPDYRRVTEEQLQPTPLFMKFMLDFSTVYCSNLAQFEPQRPADQKFFTRFTSVDENLRFLLLRFTGIEGTEADAYATRLKAAYDEGSQSAAPLSGYQTVCVALFTSPEFLLY
jgi:hypothetical protein